ncbi:hypothetical protein D5018_10310 [Parashewanella curva]|uniref:Death domain-containing protein n=1 Tax=Parashewanella curva TaxID=2338552 RepID=A0A3L8PWL2_9GAMM|nr:hypothetical protein [Parashewanella curva]RLV59754.1 hypothetical protein D5018_10310 [Parashewanella curva]
MATGLYLGGQTGFISSENNTNNARMAEVLRLWAKKPDANINDFIHALELSGLGVLARKFQAKVDQNPQFFDVTKPHARRQELGMDDGASDDVTPQQVPQINREQFHNLQDENQQLKQQIQSLQTELHGATSTNQQSQITISSLHQQIRRLTLQLQTEREEKNAAITNIQQQLEAALVNQAQQPNVTSMAGQPESTSPVQNPATCKLSAYQEALFKMHPYTKVSMNRLLQFLQRHQVNRSKWKEFATALGLGSEIEGIESDPFMYRDCSRCYSKLVTMVYARRDSTSFNVYDLAQAVSQARGDMNLVKFFKDIEDCLPKR